MGRLEPRALWQPILHTPPLETGLELLKCTWMQRLEWLCLLIAVWTAFWILLFWGELGCTTGILNPAPAQSFVGFGTWNLCRALSVIVIINFKKLSVLWIFIVSGQSGKWRFIQKAWSLIKPSVLQMCPCDWNRINSWGFLRLVPLHISPPSLQTLALSWALASTSLWSHSQPVINSFNKHLLSPCCCWQCGWRGFMAY